MFYMSRWEAFVLHEVNLTYISYTVTAMDNVLMHDNTVSLTV